MKTSPVKISPVLRIASIPAGDYKNTISLTPFHSAEQAWHWTMAALTARRDGTSRRGTGIARPCDPDDVIRSLDQLYRTGRIHLDHARVLRVWGERQVVPDCKYPAERAEAKLWREALDRLEWPLRIKGIISH